MDYPESNYQNLARGQDDWEGAHPPAVNYGKEELETGNKNPKVIFLIFKDKAQWQIAKSLLENSVFYDPLRQVKDWNDDPINPLGLRVDFAQAPAGLEQKLDELFRDNGAEIVNKIVDSKEYYEYLAERKRLYEAEQRAKQKQPAKLYQMPKPEKPQRKIDENLDIAA